MPKIRKALFQRGYIVVVIGGEITGYIQVNDTHLHRRLKSDGFALYYQFALHVLVYISYNVARNSLKLTKGGICFKQNKTAFKKIASKEGREASSVEKVSEKVLDLQKPLEKIEESTREGHVFHHKFGYIHSYFQF